ncbi:MAG: hypothetical protein ABI678_27910 [Kofleriaceae bacterium]
MTRLLLAVCLTACGNHTEPVRPTPELVVPRDAPEPNPSDAECDALIEHAIDLQTPADAGVGSDDRTKLRGEVRVRVRARWRAMPRAVYRCAMAATTLDAFTSCDPN